jgi:phosphate transport system protein
MMSRHFHDELQTIGRRLAAMGTLVESRVRDAVDALTERRLDLAAETASGDTAVNDLEVEIDDQCLTLLALQHPVASDLRAVRSILKANTDLERIGDQAVNIAQAAMNLTQRTTPKPPPEIERLAQLALAMLHDALGAFASRDPALARSVLERDDEADHTRDAILRSLVATMTANAAAVEGALALIVVTRSLERIADHATNIAEDLVFLVEGRDIRHHGHASA